MCISSIDYGILSANILIFFRIKIVPFYPFLTYKYRTSRLFLGGSELAGESMSEEFVDTHSSHLVSSSANYILKLFLSLNILTHLVFNDSHNIYDIIDTPLTISWKLGVCYIYWSVDTTTILYKITFNY